MSRSKLISKLVKQRREEAGDFHCKLRVILEHRPTTTNENILHPPLHTRVFQRLGFEAKSRYDRWEWNVNPDVKIKAVQNGRGGRLNYHILIWYKGDLVYDISDCGTTWSEVYPKIYHPGEVWMNPILELRNKISRKWVEKMIQKYDLQEVLGE